MKRHLMIWLLLGLVSISGAQTLQETVSIALENNATVKAAREETTAAGALSRSAHRTTFPALKVSSSASYITDVAEIDLAKMTGMPLGSVALGVKESYEAGVNLSYVLFSGFAQQASVSISRDQEQLAKVGLSRTEKEIALETAMSYRTIQELHLKIASLEAAEKRADLQLSRVHSLLENGMALGLDTLSISLGRLGYQQQLIVIRSAMASAQQRLAMLTGQEIAIDETGIETAAIPALNAGQTEWMQTLTIQEKLGRHAETLARSQYFPTVALQASYKIGKPGVNPIQNEWMDYGVVGIGLDWKLFDWGATSQQVRARQAQRRRVDYQRQDAEKSLKLQYDIKVREYQSILDQMAVLTRALDLAKEKMRILQLQSEQGMVSATDFNDANLELTQAELNLQEHRIQIARKVLEIDYISGSPIGAWHFE